LTRPQTSSYGSTANPAQVAVWDQPTRIFHWLLLTLVVSAWVSYEFSESFGDTLLVWHRWNGLAVLVLVVWRLLWGLFGSSTSRFRSFIPSPASALRHARAVWNGTAPRYLGHNPLGGLMIIALLLVLLTQGSLGLFAVDDNDLTGGPLNHLVSEADAKEATRRHAFIFEFILLPLAALHIAVNVFYSVIKKEPLVRAMVTGAKPAEKYQDATSAQIVERPMLRALVCLAAAAAIVFGGLVAAGAKF
jgi:cytochrome b